MKIRVLIDFTGNLNGVARTLTAGEITDLPEGEAKQLAADGYIALLSRPAVKVVTKPSQIIKAVK